MKRVLVISYFYPPYRSVGATRVSKMTKYLADSGWEAHVLTIDNCDLPPTMPIEIPADRVVRVPQAFDVAALPRRVAGRYGTTEARVHPRSSWRQALVRRAGDAYRHLCIPDPQVGWRGPALTEGRALLRRLRPDAILSSSLPNTSHLIGSSLAAESGIPWVAELRDLWTHNHNFRRIQPFRAFEQALERRVLSRASALVTVSDVLAAWLRSAYGKPTYVITNGFDSSDYPAARTPAKAFTLAYTGMFYDGRQSADALFEAMKRLAAERRISPDTFRVEFRGQFLGPLLAHAEAAGVSSFVTVLPPVSYHEALDVQSSATALLVLDWKDPGIGYYSVKVFEYLGAGRPIMSLGSPQSVVGHLLASSGAGVATERADDVERTLRRWLDEFEQSGRLAYHADPAVLNRYERRSIARELALVLDSVAQR
jgi:glycosyltransferase involved in cell wall biosynthesis